MPRKSEGASVSKGVSRNRINASSDSQTEMVATAIDEICTDHIGRFEEQPMLLLLSIGMPAK